MAFLSTLKEFFAPRQLRDREALRGFVESRAAYLVQKPVMEYTQARSNMLFSTLITERDFQSAYERCRWHSYPAALSMVIEMAEGHLRLTAETPAGSLDGALIGIAREVVETFPLPDGEPAGFWSEAIDRLESDLARAALGPPKPAREIPHARAREIFDSLPLHERLRRHDFDMFRNTLRFHLTEIAVEFEERADAKGLVRSLSA